MKHLLMFLIVVLCAAILVIFFFYGMPWVIYGFEQIAHFLDKHIPAPPGWKR